MKCKNRLICLMGTHYQGVLLNVFDFFVLVGGGSNRSLNRFIKGFINTYKSCLKKFKKMEKNSQKFSTCNIFQKIVNKYKKFRKIIKNLKKW